MKNNKLVIISLALMFVVGSVIIVYAGLGSVASTIELDKTTKQLIDTLGTIKLSETTCDLGRCKVYLMRENGFKFDIAIFEQGINDAETLANRDKAVKLALERYALRIDKTKSSTIVIDKSDIIITEQK